MELGEGVTRWQPGDKVTALTAGGGYAEYALAHEGSCMRVPAGLGMAEAACLPETFMTVWHNVFERGALKAGESAARPWRLKRHRHNGDSARGPFRRAGLRDGGQR